MAGASDGRLAELGAAYRGLAASLADTGWIASGSVALRANKCGKPNCACKADPPRPHGPYWQWTAKKAGKTVNRRLTEAQAARRLEWIANERALRATVAEMLRLSAEAMAIIEGSENGHPQTT
jgi:hypothetical protein